ncbi:MAG: hypothetical protein IJO85_11430 [Lachnospiraceae bacterium]|nr:hypothetical protein [Lachnospiraceae bacterium]
MKKKIAFVLMAVMLTGAVTACGGNTDRTSDEVQTQTQEEQGMVHLGSAEEVAAFMDEMYANIPTDMIPMSLATMELDLQDIDTVSYHTGLTDLSQIDGIAISEPMMSSVAYSVVYIRTKDGADVEQIRQTLMDNVNPAKWLCVTAEKQVAGLFGDDIFFVMAAADTADLVYEEAAKVAEARTMKVGEPLEKTNPM